MKRVHPVNRPGLAIFALVVIQVLGVTSMYGLLFKNGWVHAVKTIYAEGPFVLPESSHPILTTYTGIPLLDRLLTLGTIVFCNFLDGSTPQASLYVFQLAGQLLPVWTVMTVEGLRRANKNNIFSWPFIWGWLMQQHGYGTVMPFYCFLHLLYSPTAAPPDKGFSDAIRPASAVEVHVLPVVMVIGYVVPSIAMSIPLGWNKLHQWLIALWQGFPIWITLLRMYLARSDLRQNSSRPMKQSQLPNLDALNRAYSFAYRCATATQLATYAIIGLRSILPFSESTRNSFTFRDVFVPTRFWSVEPMSSMGLAMHNFVQYDQYFGSGALIVWALALHYKSREESMTPMQWLHLAVKALSNGLLAGPAGSMSEMMRERDQYILGVKKV